jgi:hypothetical protein
LLYPDGEGKEWPRIEKGRYVTIPIELWTKGWILKLNGRSLAVYMALLELTGGTQAGEGRFLPGERKRQYGLSDDTWTRATRELQDLGLLVVESEMYGDYELEMRVRKRYRLTTIVKDKAPRW